MDAQYLSDNVGAPLSKALASCTLLRPEDPVEYVALYLLKYVQNWENVQKEKEVQTQLEEEKKYHQQQQEYEALRVAEEARSKAEGKQKHYEDQLNKQRQLFRNLEDKVEALDKEAADDASANTYRPPLHHRREKENTYRSFLTSFEDHLPRYLLGEVSDLASHEEDDTPKEPSDDKKRLAQAILLLLGQKRDDVVKWRRAAREIKKSQATLTQRIHKYSCLTRQPIKRFAYLNNLLSLVDVSSHRENKSEFGLVLIYDWLQTISLLRREAQHNRSVKLGIQVKEEPELHFGSEDEEDEDDEQDNLEFFLTEDKEPETSDERQEETEETEAIRTAANGRTEVMQLLWYHEMKVAWGDLLYAQAHPSIVDNATIRYAAYMGLIEWVRTLMSDPRVDPSARGLQPQKDIMKWYGYSWLILEAIKKASSEGHAMTVQLLLTDPRVDPSVDDQYAIRHATDRNTARVLLADHRVNPTATDSQHKYKEDASEPTAFFFYGGNE
ncbi:Dydc1 protein [Planoprotostelium fungivorum]|uniref:Dydc1 protein n=1 Tax=Planoprotostelium fungivorum TaxID=1890364 RepID=A0A2P6NEH4_9EUKA|nr:Dydc1 protein [Planoprotostelium fungivorum]